MPTPVLSLHSPCQKVFQAHPNNDKLKVFDYLCYPWFWAYTHYKLEEHSKRCVFLGYSTTQSVYLCLDISTGHIYVPRHVQFDENCFPFSETNTSSLTSELANASAVPLATPLSLPPSLPATSYMPMCSILHPTSLSPLSAQPATSPQPHVSSSLSNSSSSSPNFESNAPNENGPEPMAQQPPTSQTTTSTPSQTTGPKPNTNTNPIPPLQISTNNRQFKTKNHNKMFQNL